MRNFFAIKSGHWIILLVVTAICSVLTSGYIFDNLQVKASPLVLADSFETGISGNWNCEMLNKSYSGTISNLYASEGASSLRIELRKYDCLVNWGKRSEIAMVNREKPLEEHDYSFATLLPKGGIEDYALDPNGSEIIAQWHNTPDQGEEDSSPPIALHTGAYYNNPDRYTLEVNWDPSPTQSGQTIAKEDNHAIYDLGSFVSDKGKWVEWTFHIKWGWKASQKPLLEIYKDGVKVLDLKDYPNTTNDKVGIYMKLGIYKWDWGQVKDKSILTKRVIYYDNVMVR